MGAEQRSGFVVWHRRVFDSWLWSLPPAQFKVAFAIVGFANWQPSRWLSSTGPVDLERGELVVSVASLAAAARVTTKQVRDTIRKLRDASMIEVVAGRASRYTRIRVINYDSYQDIEPPQGEKRASEGQVEGEQRATGKPVNQVTRSGQGENPQTYSQQQADLFGGADPAPAAVNGSHLAAVTRRCVDYLNRKAGRRLTDEPYRDLVRKCLDGGHTEREINLVFWWAAEYEWPKDADDRNKRLHPNCLLPMKKPSGWRAFPQYLDLAREKYHEVKKQEFNPNDRSDDAEQPHATE